MPLMCTNYPGANSWLYPIIDKAIHMWVQVDLTLIELGTCRYNVYRFLKTNYYKYTCISQPCDLVSIQCKYWRCVAPLHDSSNVATPVTNECAMVLGRYVQTETDHGSETVPCDKLDHSVDSQLHTCHLLHSASDHHQSRECSRLLKGACTCINTGLKHPT